MAPPERHLARSEVRSHASRNSTSSSSALELTPPLSPPQHSTSSRTTAPRAPAMAHFNPFLMSSPNNGTIPIPARAPEAPNPYSTTSNDSYNVFSQSPPDYAYQYNAFDLPSNPTSPVSPSFPPGSYPPIGNPGNESLFDRWLRHEDLARPIFPGSRTGSSIATSDISSVREGMFGSLPSLPGVRSSSDSRKGGQGVGSGPGSVISAGTRDRDNFSSSAPSYPSSRAGGSRPSSRGAPSDAEITSMPASPTIAYMDLTSRLNYTSPAPPPAPTPPTSSNVSSASSEFSGENGIGSRVNLPEPPEAAATRPPRYSDTFAGAIGLEELINRDIAIGGQGIIPLQIKSEKGRKGGAAEATRTVMLVEEDVWIEMTRLAGLAQQQGQGSNTANGGRPGSSNYEDFDLEMGMTPQQRQEWKKEKQKKRRSARCCGVCVIS